MLTLFENLPVFPVARPDDELRLLAVLPEWPTIMAVSREERPACRRLERDGLIKVSRQKDDDLAEPTWYAGKLPAAGLREVQP